MKQTICLLSVVFAFCTLKTAMAAPYWDKFSDKGCQLNGTRKYSAVLLGVTGSWEEACDKEEAGIGNDHFAKPTRCKNEWFHEWGELDVPDSYCYPQWGELKKGDCTSVGFRQQSAIQWYDPGSWEDACLDRGQTYIKLGENLVYFARPNRCRNTGLNMWGEFDVPDVSCHGKGTTEDILLSKANDQAQLIRKYVGFPADGSKKVYREDIVDFSQTATIVLDIGGEGPTDFKGFHSGMAQAINVNVNVNDVNAITHLPVPALVKITSFNNRYPFADVFADYIIMQNSPLTDHNVTEIARRLNRCGRVGLWIEEESFEKQIMELARLLNAPVQRNVSPDEAHAPQDAYQKLLIQKPC